jgi:high mobility group protein B1
LFRSAFFWFCNDERPKVKAINPEYGVGDVAKELGKRWSDADPEVKSKYEAMAEKDKARYDRVSWSLLFNLKSSWIPSI